MSQDLTTDLPTRIRDVIAHKGCLSDETALRAADKIELLRELLIQADKVVVWECTSAPFGFQQRIERALEM